ncbi:MAG TPA: NUDIX hydrolase [Verrucomicrobiae bacterium]|nr:NUDIX hydrolase [Verrucomicrobiae bacterium]
MKRETRAKATVLHSEVLYQGPVFNVAREKIKEPNGLEVTKVFVQHPGSVVVLPVFDNGDILLIRQYRHAAGEYLWELVAGRKDEGENFAQGARRELKEETGYSAKRLKKLAEMFPTPGFVQERMVLFLAQGLKAGQASPEDDEKIDAKIVTRKTALAWVRSGTIHDMKTVAGILYYDKFLRRGGNVK